MATSPQPSAMAAGTQQQQPSMITAQPQSQTAQSSGLTAVPAPPSPTLYYAVQTANGTQYRPVTQPATTTVPAATAQQSGPAGPAAVRPVITSPLVIGSSTAPAPQSAAAAASGPATAASLPAVAAAPAQAAAADAPSEAAAAAAVGPAAKGPAGALTRAMADALAPAVALAQADAVAAGVAAPAAAGAAEGAEQPAAPVAAPALSILQRDVLP